MSDRLVSANKLIKSINRQIDKSTAPEKLKEIVRRALLLEIANTPTVDSVKHGHWIVYDEGEGYPNTCECSNCGTFYDEEDAYCYDCCPTCGAKMDEVEE